MIVITEFDCIEIKLPRALTTLSYVDAYLIFMRNGNGVIKMLLSLTIKLK